MINVVAKIRNKFSQFKRKLYPSEFDLEIIRWFKDNGDQTLRLDYNGLNENSVLFDLGGYKGQFASDIYSKYKCKIFIFEPVSLFAEQIKNRFKYNTDIKVYNFGLGAKDEKFNINIDNDASSLLLHNSGSNLESVSIQNFGTFLKHNNIDIIDLIKINIEGAEFDLMDYILENDLISSIKIIQIQFHNFFADADRRRENIVKKLKQTHKQVWCYKFVWECWILK